MQHLPLIKDASAVLVVRGAITSHLIQHIEAAKIPVAVGVVEANALVAGDAIRVSDRGGVIHA
jgi:phosphohistidine swiveling domain-containing protein